jgi:hypothetical protein
MKCILCVMLMGKRHQVRELVRITLLKDSGGKPFLGAEIAMCTAHQSAVPVIIQVTPGEVPETIVYDKTVNFFAKPHPPGIVLTCASCSHEEADHDVGENGACAMDCDCLSFESPEERQRELQHEP